MNLSSTIFLKGPRVYLRLLCEEDARGEYPQWLNDAQVSQGNNHHRLPYSQEAALEYIRFSRTTRDNLILAICLKENDQHIGNIALQNIDWIYRHAEFSILIGHRAAWGKGYSKEAAGLLVDHGFGALYLHRIHCGTTENNHAMIRLAQYLGMQREGLDREVVFKDGRYLNSIRFGVLEGEYQKKF